MFLKRSVLFVLLLSVFAVAATVDYSLDRNWSYKCENIKQKVDVFFVHPTTYTTPSGGKLHADLSDSELNEKTDKNVARQSGAFTATANLFAPRYRQMNIEVLSMSDEKKDEYLEMPVEDIKRAFEYYMTNLNEGRPFILASHSQGSNVLQKMLLESPQMLEGKKLVAAYLIGWSFSDEQLEKMGLPLGEKPDQTGCVLTWNTIAPGGNSPTLKEGARCVNPLSWTSNTAQYPASMNICSRIQLNDGSVITPTNFTAAKINSYGGLEIPAPQPQIQAKLNMMMGPSCYHPYDYDFFYCNIAQNTALRCKSYLDKR